MTAFYFPSADCVFIHIPKTGGASIRHGFFKSQYEGPVQGEVPQAWQHCFKFAFVRNPFDRLISAWKMFTTGMENSRWQYPEDGNPNLSLRQFLEIAMDDSIPFDTAPEEVGKSFEIKLRHHALPQTHPFYCLEHATFTGRFESMKEDFQKVCKRLNLDGDLPHMNKTDRDDYRQYFDETTKAMASRFYEKDIRQLNYSF